MEFKTWQEFEEFTKDVLDKHGFETEFRKVFSTERKYEIDIVAYSRGLILCLDCKLYGKHRYRASSLKQQARLHKERVQEFRKKTGQKCIPIIVSFLDDNLLLEEGCLFVPVEKLNDFLNNIVFYLEELGL